MSQTLGGRLQAIRIRQAIERLRQFERFGVFKATKQAFYRALDVGRTRAVAALKRSTIGTMVDRRGNVQLQLGLSKRKRGSSQYLAALRQSTIPLIVRRSEVFTSASGIRGGLETMGFAALIESGGRTKAHQIKPIRLGGYSRRRATRAKQLAGMPPLTIMVGGKWRSPKIVTHPGSRVPKNPFLGTGATAVQQALPPELERALADEIGRAGL